MNSKKYHVCIIDHQTETRKTISQTLKDSLKLQIVGSAEDIETGMALIDEHVPDAVFLDVKLKGSNAFQLLSFIKRKLDHLPAIILNTEFKDYKYAQKISNYFKDEVVMILIKSMYNDWPKKEDELVRRIEEYYELQMNKTQIPKRFTVWT